VAVVQDGAVVAAAADARVGHVAAAEVVVAVVEEGGFALVLLMI
jgi:hypothetical protein